METFPSEFIRNVIGLRGDAGREWLRRLPEIVGILEQKWSLTALPHYALSYNFVAPAVRADGSPVVLKIGFPQSDVPQEIAALSRMNPQGVCRVLDFDAANEAVLLERVSPGTMLAELCYAGRDDEATRHAAQAMRHIHAPASNPEEPSWFAFDTLAQWGEGFVRLRERLHGGTGPFPADLVDTAEGLWRDLLASSPPPVLLHGDLHHDNLLAGERAPYLVIDPKGVIGDPAYETAPFLLNPNPFLKNYPEPDRLTARRIAILSEELDIERERIQSWGVAFAVLSAWWYIEDSDEFTHDGFTADVTAAEFIRAAKI
ncbi:MAG: aminoglycoside phosphotransferase family protein [Armatimonadaceae bacterium]